MSRQKFFCTAISLDAHNNNIHNLAQNLASDHIISFLSGTEMLEFLPDGVEVLLFNGNQIPVLDWNLFGIWDEHPKLQVKYLGVN